ncbi:MAG: type II secretion system F family protein [Deltaproteobacteria bacterium]|nr:type II secretion system F family protein [Deltaproteobacteria bacterium]
MAEVKNEARTRTGQEAGGKAGGQGGAAAAAKKKAGGLNVNINLKFGGRVKSKDLKTFTRQFATMIDAGLPLVQCLEILGSQSENKWFGVKLLEIKGIVEGGSTFSDALAKFPKIFDDLFVNLVAAGELGGILDTIMKRLADYIEKKERLARRVKGAMVYPAVILVVTVVVVTVLLKWVIPTFEKMFADFGAVDALPAPTKVVIGLSNGFQENFVFIFAAIIAIVVGYSAFYKSRPGKTFMHRLFLLMPVIGPVVRKTAVARFTRTLGTLLSSGVPILDALNTVAKAAGNVIIERAILFARERISEGRNMSEPLAEAKVFPGMVIQMIAVGEQTGSLDVMCNKIADFYEEEVDVAVAALTSMLEPLMMVVIGGLVGGMVIAMYLPIFSLAGTIKAD